MPEDPHQGRVMSYADGNKRNIPYSDEDFQYEDE